MSRTDQDGSSAPTASAVERALVVLGPLVALAGLAALLLAIADVGPRWLDQVGAVTVATAYSAMLAIRTGGRPLVFGLLALAVGAATLRLDYEGLRAGSALLTAVVAAVLAVMITVPAVSVWATIRELLIAYVVAAVGGLAVLGFRPEVSLVRFDYTSQGLALLLILALVFRLGAGLHGLGRRGLLAVFGGLLLLAASAAYAELFRRYGPDGFLEQVFDGVRRVHDAAGAFPRPIQVLIGIPALVWGTHMRAFRRQGWWVCAFGVAATASVAGLLIDPAVNLTEAGLILAYSLGLGWVAGVILIRIDRLFTGPRGRRAQRVEVPLRPEPRRHQPLL